MNATRNGRQRTWLGPAIALALAGLFLVVGWATVGHYGITWDEPENFLAGDLYWRFFRTGDRTWLDFEALKNQWAVADEKPLFYVYTIGRQERYPPVANLVSAITGWLLDEKLGWADPIDAHHAAIPLFGALGVFVTTLFAWQARADGDRHALAPAIVAGGCLALFPLYWGQAHNNVKDVPMAALFAATLWASWRAFGRDRGIDWRWTIAAGILWGLSLGTKANGLILLPVWVAWLVWLRVWPGFRTWRASHPWRRQLWPALAFVVLGGLTLLAVWPYLWDDPARRHLCRLALFHERRRGVSCLLRRADVRGRRDVALAVCVDASGLDDTAGGAGAGRRRRRKGGAGNLAGREQRIGALADLAGSDPRYASACRAW